MRERIIFLHGIYLNTYRGTLDGFYPGGFKWAAENGWGGEVFNFQPVAGRCYGHVEVLDHSIHIEKLGTSLDSPSIDDVLVVWTAPDPSPRRGRLVVGWYRHATVHRDRQNPTGALRKARTFVPPAPHERRPLSYQVEAAEQHCTLLAPEERVLWIPPRKKGKKGIPGQSPVYFPMSQKVVGPEIADRVRRFIETGEALSLEEVVRGKHSSKRGRHQPDPERRKEIEDEAMGFVTRHFQGLNFQVDDVSLKNLGYDLCARKGDVTLCIEVKGRSGRHVTADFTFNEFDKIRLEERGKFGDGSYRICIVTDVLNEGIGARLHHFWYVAPTAVQKARGVKPAWRNIENDQILELLPREAAQARLAGKVGA
ncbi:DUF3883 domain-containing protein [uncultured Agrobacterium sp.]|uniref:protein NO VEIN domain-containing protein n=1 Tax=uncultured Agrobacterium sp. TaxID=157277 RepID=UPI0025ECD6CC|nr:DUF3883 domain-containing protein [uncultured Agrobacterium sp.]